MDKLKKNYLSEGTCRTHTEPTFKNSNLYLDLAFERKYMRSGLFSKSKMEELTYLSF